MFFILYVKLYWARSKRKKEKMKICKHKELKTRREWHERNTQAICGVPTLGLSF